MLCKSCNKKNLANAKFCTKCGKKIETVTEANVSLIILDKVVNDPIELLSLLGHKKYSDDIFSLFESSDLSEWSKSHPSLPKEKSLEHRLSQIRLITDKNTGSTKKKIFLAGINGDPIPVEELPLDFFVLKSGISYSKTNNPAVWEKLTGQDFDALQSSTLKHITKLNKLLSLEIISHDEFDAQVKWLPHKIKVSKDWVSNEGLNLALERYEDVRKPILQQITTIRDFRKLCKEETTESIVSHIQVYKDKSFAKTRKSILALSAVAMLAASYPVYQYLYLPWSHNSAWNNAERADSIPGYKKYISKYPSGENVGIASNKIDELTWEVVIEQNTISSFTDYLDNFPEGKQKLNARQNISKLKWLKVSETNSIEAVDNYFKNYPETTFRNEVKKSLLKLLLEKCELRDLDSCIRIAKEYRKDDWAKGAISSADTVIWDSYSKTKNAAQMKVYLELFPRGKNWRNAYAIINPSPLNSIENIGEFNSAFSMELSKNGENLAATTYNGAVSVWNTETGSVLKAWPENPNGDFSKVGLSGDGKTIAYSAPWKKTKVLSLPTVANDVFLDTKTSKTRIGVPVAPAPIFFDNDQKILTIGDEIIEWSASTGSMISKWGVPKSWITISPDSKRFVTSETYGKVLVLWDLNSKQRIKILQDESGVRGPQNAVFSPDGSLLISGDGSKHIVIRDSYTGAVKMKFKEDNPSSRKMKFSSNGNFFAMKSSDDVRVFDIEKNQEIAKFKRPDRSYLGDFALTDDGKYMIISNLRGKVWLWDVFAQKIVENKSVKGGIDVVFVPEQRAFIMISSEKVYKWNLK